MLTAVELDEVLTDLNRTIADCVLGRISFAEFQEAYGYPIGEYALDGHETDMYEPGLLEARSRELRIHFEIADRVMQDLCSEEQATDPMYVKANRHGPKIALDRLRELAIKHDVVSAT